MAVDPVCRMKVEPAKTAAMSEHGGQMYSFCSGTVPAQAM